MALSTQDLAGFVRIGSFDVYEWRVDSTRPARADEVCGADLECGCCYCEQEGVIAYEVSRPRYSRSRKEWVLESDVFVECADCID